MWLFSTFGAVSKDNHDHYIWKVFNILPNVSLAISESKHDYEL